jgi:hypothetical protein
LHRQAQKLAGQKGISTNQFVTEAVVEKISAILKFDGLQERAKLGSREHFKAILDKVPDRAPLPGDEL